MELERLNKNKMISEFMGYYQIAGTFYPKKGGKGKWFKEAKYHYSWDALMPVFNECLKTYTEIMKDPEWDYLVKGDSFMLPKFALKHALHPNDIDGQLHINSAWLKITDFIQWYTDHDLKPKKDSTNK